MRRLKSAIQDVADRMNNPIIEDNISSIKEIAVIDKNIQDAIQLHKKKKEEVTKSSSENIIVTAEDIRKTMNREIDL